MTRHETAYQRGKRAGRAQATVVTDDMVERAAQAAWEHMSVFPRAETLPSLDSASRNDVGTGMRYRRAQRAALEAALNPEPTVFHQDPGADTKSDAAHHAPATERTRP